MCYIKYPLFVFLLFALSFCNNAKVTDSIENNIDSAKVNTDTIPIVSNPTVTKDSLIAIEIQRHELPANISFKGKDFYSAYKWYDKNGHNLLVLSTSTSSVANKEIDENENSGELFAQQFNLDDPSHSKTVWEMYDAKLKCIFDLTCAFINTEITDLDNNGIKETFIAYKTTCRSDVSPADMKVIMHEGKKKYALRGKMVFIIRDIPDTLFPETREIDLSKISKEEIEKTMFRDWGCFENTNDFNNAPPKFLEFAKQFWRDNSFEN